MRQEFKYFTTKINYTKKTVMQEMRDYGKSYKVSRRQTAQKQK